MTLLELLKKEFNLTKDEYNNHCSDLQILCNENIINYLKKNNIKYTVYCSNAKGQSWYGKQFIEIPFAYSEYHTNNKYF